MILRRVALLSVAVLLANSALAQKWTKLHTFPGPLSSVLFLNESVGFVGIGIGPGASYTSAHDIYKTTDGGTAWIKAKAPAPTGTGDVTLINILDSMNGWASVIDYSNGTGLWKTSDGGLTWTDVPLPVAGPRRGSTSVAVTSHALVVTDIYGSALISTDNGKKFSAMSALTSNNFSAFVDDVHGVMCSYRGVGWSFTSDGGVTWQASNMTTECWSVYPVIGTSEFYASPEGTSDILHSVDYGVTWSKCGTTPTEHAGHITGIGNNFLFCQGRHSCRADTGIAADGFFVSSDKGVTWMSIGGPVNCSDVRFSVLSGSCGYQVYAFDLASTGTLWHYQSAATNGSIAQVTLPNRSAVANAGDTVDIPILLTCMDQTKPVVFAASSNENISLYLNANFLTPIEFRATTNGTGSFTSTNQTSVDLSIHWNSAETISTNTTIGVLRCVVNVADTTEAVAVLTKCSADGTGADCIAQSVPEDGGSEHFQLLPPCGLAELVGFMKHGMIPEGIVDIRPNPARGDISVIFRNDLRRPISYELVSSLGTSCIQETTSMTEVTLDVSRLTNGIYYLRATSPQGEPILKKVVVSH